MRELSCWSIADASKNIVLKQSRESLSTMKASVINEGHDKKCEKLDILTEVLFFFFLFFLWTYIFISLE